MATDGGGDSTEQSPGDSASTKDLSLGGRERLVSLDELEADGTITEEEHAQLRAHILGEL